MVTECAAAAGKYPLTEQMSLTLRTNCTFGGGRKAEGSGVDVHWAELASPLLKLLNRALSSG